jgi:hypothetical protein
MQITVQYVGDMLCEACSRHSGVTTKRRIALRTVGLSVNAVRQRPARQIRNIYFTPFAGFQEPCSLRTKMI